MLIISGPARVVEHGIVTAFLEQPLRFELELGIFVVMRFETDPARGDVSVESELMPGGLVLVLYNFDGADGRGSAQPVLVGEVGPDLVFLHFRVFRYGRTDDRTVQYTFYRVPAAAVDGV